MTRSILFGAEPVGRGTGAVESLTGFFARLCVARYVLPTDVVRAHFLERCPSGFFPSSSVVMGSYLGISSSNFDLRPDRALPFARALEDLTCIDDLAALTFSVGATLFFSGPAYTFGRRRKRWCPACLAGWAREGAPLYEPLLWRFALVERCHEHRLPLLESCPFCGRRQPLITRGVPIGHCIHCGHLLHEGVPVVPPDEQSLSVADRFALWRSVALSWLLACSSAPGGQAALAPDTFLSSFRRLLDSVLQERSALGAACALGLNPAHFYRILSGEARPALRFFLDACMQLGVDPARVARGDCVAGERSWPPSQGSSLAACSDPWGFALEAREFVYARRYPDRAGALDAFISDPDAVDLAALMREHHATPPWLSSAFPLRHGRARALRAERLAHSRSCRSRTYDDVLAAEIAAGAPRSLAAVALSLGTNVTALSTHSPALAAELVALRQSSFGQRSPSFCARVRAALVVAIATPEGPTLNGVATSLGVVPSTVERCFPELVARLRSRRVDDRAARYARYANALRDDLASDSPRGVTFVAGQLGICLATLRRAAPALYAKSTACRYDASRRRARRSGVREATRTALVACLSAAVERQLRSDTPCSALAVARSCGVRLSYFSRHLPGAYRELLAHRRAARSSRLRSLRDAMSAELAQLEPRSPFALAAALHVAHTTLLSASEALFFELRDAAARARALRRARRRPRGADHPRLVADLESEICSPTPRSVRALSRALGVSPNKLRSASADAVARLVAASAAYRARCDALLAERAESAMSCERPGDIPQSVASLARRLGVSRGVLNRAAPELYRRIVSASAVDRDCSSPET